MPRLTSAAIALVAIPLAALTGCTSPQNDRLELGTDLLLPTFQEPVHVMSAAGPSITGLDRSNWALEVFEVPVNGVAHQPPYAPPTYDLAALPRQRGEEPTPETALDLGEPDLGAEIGQTFRSHGLAVLDALLIVPRLVIRPPTATNWSPTGSYERAPALVITAPWCQDCGAPCTDSCSPEPTAPEPAATDTGASDSGPSSEASGG